MYQDFIGLQERHWWFVHRNKIVSNIIKALSLYGKKILVAGCGMGAEFKLFDSKKNKIMGVDKSVEAISFCKKKYPHIDLDNF